MGWLRDGISWAGFAVGAAAWAISTQLNYALVGSGQLPGHSVCWITLALGLIAIGGGLLSWRAWRSARGSMATQVDGDSRQFLAGVGAISSLLFTAAIACQGIAALIVR